ncbi:MAG: antibiotic biosynthesis monooxygenase [Ardenticatenaceae bacterium]|nr:antibiotic biosynthesis monooxygenase [Ardenticatenaceae bacterium]MCB8988011.1 antibiotic biosynthesis monooxygenase [Ardenticatenaceae bacterium]
MTGKLIAHSGKRDELAAVLLRAAEVVGQLPGCRLYAVSAALDDDTTIWVMEVWDDKAAHDASLEEEGVRTLIAAARPLLGGPPDGAELHILGGHGLENRPQKP